jgi:hypothetical protein
MFQLELEKLQLAGNSSNTLLRSFRSMIQDQVRSYDGVYKAEWLLSDWDDEKWQTSAGERTRTNVAGNIVGTFDTNWSVVMPDGALLTSAQYELILGTIKKVSFLYRMGLISGTIPSLTRWGRFNLDMINLASYLVLNGDRYRPSTCGFKLMDQSGLENLFYLCSRGGWTEALALGKRTVDAFYTAAYNAPCPPDLLLTVESLPTNVIEKICNWLVANEAYRKEDKSALDRSFVAERINAPVKSLISEKFSAIIRQFEPDLYHATLQIRSRSQKTEHLGHCTPIKTEIFKRGNSETSFLGVTTSVLNLIRAYRHFSDEVPSPDTFKFDTARRKAIVNCSTDSHTPFIPIDIGFMYLNESIRWVEVYGDALIDFYLSVLKKLSRKVKNSVQKKWGQVIYRDYHKFVDEIGVPEVLKSAGFKFSSMGAPLGRSRDFERFHADPSLDEVIEIFIGAATVILGFLKPSRDIEICTLPRDCLLRDSAGRYWIDSALAKRTKAEVRAKTGAKPIPDIVAKAIQQLQRLGNGLCEIFEEQDTYMRSRLFYLRNTNKNGVGVTVNGQMLSGYLDRFCDYVNSPLDYYGRRWYLRIHEMRKWFLLLLFWCGRYDILDAARWIASHTNIKHIYAYISRELPATQLGSIEADWAIHQLASYDVSGTTHDNCQGISHLYEQVLRQFKSKSLSFIDERQWKTYVKTLFQGQYYLEPFMIKVDDNNSGICVAIRAEGRTLA